MAKVLMQALSSGLGGDGALKTWLADTPDFLGASFPGPGTPADIVIAGSLPAAASPGGGGGGGAGDGFLFTFDASTSDADPGNGKVRFDSATIGSVAHLFVDTLDAHGSSIAAYLDSLTSGRIRVQSLSDPTKWAEFQFSGVTTATGYRKLNVSGGVGTLPLTTTDDTFVSFDLGGSSFPLTGDVSAASHKITSLGNGTAAGDAVNKGQMDAGDASTLSTAESFATSAAAAVATSADESTLHLASGVYSVKANGVGNSQLRQGAACTVIGRGAGTAGNVADISAAVDNVVLRRRGGVLGFGAVDLALDVADLGAAFQRLRVNAAGTALEYFTDGAVFNLSGASNALLLAHLDAYVRVSHTAETDLTVPKNATAAIPVGGLITGVQAGVGQLVFVPEDGTVIINVPANSAPKCLQQGSAWALKKVATGGTDVYDLTGDLEPL